MERIILKKDILGKTPLHMACECGFFEVSKLLLSYGADPSLCDKRGNTPLHLACFEAKNYDVIKILLENGANPSATNTLGKIPLECARKEEKKNPRAFRLNRFKII